MTKNNIGEEELARLRRELAGAFRWAARLDMHEGIANHFSAAVGGSRFLINPGGRHFSTIRASELLLLDANSAEDGGGADPTALCLHAGLHRHAPHAKCVMHLHPAYATALASLAEWRMLSCDQNACRFHNRVAYDDHFGGMLLADEEAARQARALDGKKILVMRGHGILTAAADIGEAFDLMYYFERACRNQWLALSCGRPLLAIADDIAEKTARQWESYPAPRRHFDELLVILDREEPDYRD